MAQHFLLSAQARTLSLAKVMRMTEEGAYETFARIRWAQNDGEPFCPRCGCVAVYTYQSRRIYKCQGCESQFSITTDTIFASRKLSLRDLLAAIAIFVNGAKGISALQLSRDLDCQYKTAFVLAHKLREAMGAEMKHRKLSGHVEVDGAYFGGYVRPENRKEDRVPLLREPGRAPASRRRRRLDRSDQVVIPASGDALTLRVPARLKLCSGEMRFVIPPGQARDQQPRPNATLIKALTRAHRWKERLFTGAAPSTSAIANEEGVTERYVSRIMRLAFLAPDIVEAILDGHQPADLELERLLKGIPISWDAQRRALGFSRA